VIRLLVGRSQGGVAMSTSLLVELERDRALGVDPAGSALWPRAPWELRRQYADGLVSAEVFWSALERWLRGTA
jgi:hypothetical protein